MGKNKLLFALDIGTRSVVGLVGEQTDDNIRLVASERKEHHTRAMLDGQIHDVPEVAKVIAAVKDRLEHTCGPLKKVSVAAAGRSLCTIRAKAEIEHNGVVALSATDERALELAAIQSAQQQLAASNAVEDPASYYCVGYSVISFTLDNTPLKSLIGQRGKVSTIDLIATFLPRQVIDSLQSAVHAVGLEIATLTLEPIAAINVLIPETMRHLNLALVDIGAGTSDVAITKDGSVIAYGMVPCAGDEITEALSQKYLLDFNVAETLKRQLGAQNKKVNFTDILGTTYKLSTIEIIDNISKNVAELAQAIARQIIALNAVAPQAVLLVGGGSLTPMLPGILAQALEMPESRVAVRKPEVIDSISNIPASLYAPDAVTPLGILKLSKSETLNFVNVTLNDQPLRLFNLGRLTVADALLAGGLDVRTLHGRPGMGITITVNGKTKFLPGTHGHPGFIRINGQDGDFNDQLQNDDNIEVCKGTDGITPSPAVREVADIPASFTICINDQPCEIQPIITVNNIAVTADTQLNDRDQVVCKLPVTLEEILALTGNQINSIHYDYTINDAERSYTVCPRYTVNGSPATPDTKIHANDTIHFLGITPPTLGEVLGITEETAGERINVLFNGTACSVYVRRFSFTVNNRPAQLTDTLSSGSTIDYSSNIQSFAIISDVLLAANFNPRELPPGTRVNLMLNDYPAEFITPIKSGDKIEVITTNIV